MNQSGPVCEHDERRVDEESRIAAWLDGEFGSAMGFAAALFGAAAVVATLLMISIRATVVALTRVPVRDSVTTGHVDGEEDAMTLNDQVDALQARAAELKSSFDASRQETSEKIKQRIADVKAKAAAAQTSAHDHVDESVDRAHSQWQTFKGDVSAKMRELKERVQRKRDDRDAKDAEKAAERAEEYASDSLDFAAWAIAEAEMDVLDAVDARVIANAKAAGSPSS